MISRRGFVAGLIGLPVGVVAETAMPARVSRQLRLAELARAKGLFFGSAVTREQVTMADAYRRLLVEQCDVWTPEWQLKWAEIEAAPSERRYAAADAILAASLANGKQLRGHTLLWHSQLPGWLDADTHDAAGWAAYVEPYLTETLHRYKGQFFHWDVVNEAIEPNDGAPAGLRRSLFYAMLGRDYIARAFDIAHALAPSAKLYLNDYGLCQDPPWQEARRATMLRLLESLVGAGAPIHGLGIQAHLDEQHGFNERRFADFLRRVAALGLEITVTELDVTEAQPPRGSIETRDRRVADLLRAVLSVALDQPALRGVVTWGLSDRVSWLRTSLGLGDNRGLPYDEELRPTPMHGALAELFRNAPHRSL